MPIDVEAATEHGGETAAVSATETNAVALAWSSEVDTYEAAESHHDHWRARLLWAPLLMALVATAAAVLWFSATLYREERGLTVDPSQPSTHISPAHIFAAPARAAHVPTPPTPQPPSSAAPTPTTVVFVVPPPVSTEVPPPPAGTPELPAPVPVFEDSRDQWLLNNLRSLGYTIVDPSLVIANAHQACRLLQQGESTDQMDQQMQARMGANMTDTLQLTSSAMLAYPNCY
jgi:hypothetical protein